MSSHDVPIRVDHVGIAVRSIEDAEPLLTVLGCVKLVDETIDDAFRWAYYELGGASRIELIEPVGDDTFLTRYLDEHGPGLHHVTLEVADIDRVIDHLEQQGVGVVHYTDRGDWIEAFLSPGNPTGTLFQLMEFRERYARRRADVDELLIGGGRLSE